MAFSTGLRRQLNMTPPYYGVLRVPWHIVTVVASADVDRILPLGEIVIQLAQEDSPLRVDDWAILSSPQLTAPVRVRRLDAASGGPSRVRLSYAARTIWNVKKGEKIGLGALPAEATAYSLPRRGKQRLIGTLDKMLERALGAPELHLRSTEAVIGDDTERVVRVDPTALDLLGTGKGCEVIVGWLDREVRARVLESTEAMWVRMRAQLTGITGQQAIVSPTTDVPLVIEHLAVWLPAPLRAELGAPKDTVVRIRRRVWPVVRSHANEALLPLLGIVVGIAALPTTPK
ncbi:MAG: hypothetical protein LC808_34720, partial [Actinobacteria bacterium]|nr:hypothetical protein [Actinomycetota bacterium]